MHSFEDYLVNLQLIKRAKDSVRNLEKQGFIPAGNMGGGAPMPPPPPGGGGMGMPVDPAMLGAAGGGGMGMPIDPAMLGAAGGGGGGGMPIDPAMLGAMGGGAPGDAALLAALSGLGGAGGGGGAGNAGAGGGDQQQLVDAIVNGIKEALKEQQGGGQAASAAPSAPKFKIDIGVEIMKLNKMVARIADALGINIPAQDMIVTPEEVAALQQQQMATGTNTATEKTSSDSYMNYGVANNNAYDYSGLDDIGMRARLIWAIRNNII